MWERALLGLPHPSIEPNQVNVACSLQLAGIGIAQVSRLSWLLSPLLYMVRVRLCKRALLSNQKIWKDDLHLLVSLCIVNSVGLLHA